MLTQQAYDLMPRVKITDLLFEVDQWTNFTHLKSDAEPPDRTLLLTAILAEAFNLGLEKMADARHQRREAVVDGGLVYPRRDLSERTGRGGNYQHGLSSGLNKGEARNSLARAVFFYRLGEIRDRSYENQRYRASGLKLVVAAITLWNTVYLERSIAALRQQREIDDSLISRIAPVGWNHINLTGDYVWHANKRVAKGRFRPLRHRKSAGPPWRTKKSVS